MLKDKSDQNLSPIYQEPSGIEAFPEDLFQKAEREGLNLFAEAPRVKLQMGTSVLFFYVSFFIVLLAHMSSSHLISD